MKSRKSEVKANLFTRDEARRIAVNIARANRLNEKHSPSTSLGAF
jgi:Na+/serine symporter